MLKECLEDRCHPAGTLVIPAGGTFDIPVYMVFSRPQSIGNATIATIAILNRWFEPSQTKDQIWTACDLSG